MGSGRGWSFFAMASTWIRVTVRVGVGVGVRVGVEVRFRVGVGVRVRVGVGVGSGLVLLGDGYDWLASPYGYAGCGDAYCGHMPARSTRRRTAAP